MKLIDKIICIIFIIIIVSFMFIRSFSEKSEIILLDYATLKSTNIINSIINKSINKVLYESKYDNIIKDYKNSEGNIVNIDFDNLIVNRILYLITEDLLNSISNIEKSNFESIGGDYLNKNNNIYYLPYGIIYDTPILNNLGPKIPFKLEFMGSINNETNINVKEYGINSSIIELLLSLKIQIQVIMPFKSKIVTINKNIILDSKIVQGKVPNYYGGLISNSLN